MHSSPEQTAPFKLLSSSYTTQRGKVWMPFKLWKTRAQDVLQSCTWFWSCTNTCANPLHLQELSSNYEVPGAKIFNKHIKSLKSVWHFQILLVLCDLNKIHCTSWFCQIMTLSQTLLKHFSLGPQSSAVTDAHWGTVHISRLQSDCLDTIHGFMMCKAEPTFTSWGFHSRNLSLLPWLSAVSSLIYIFYHSILWFATQLTSTKQPIFLARHTWLGVQELFITDQIQPSCPSWLWFLHALAKPQV